MSVDAWLSMGSNVGGRLERLRFGLQRLQQLGKIDKISSIYETGPWGGIDQPSFYNLVCKLTLDSCEPYRLLDKIKAIEVSVGRKLDTLRWGPRPLDLDVLLMGDMVLHDENLTIPHPRIAERRFVLIPLVEMDAELMHPELKQTMDELLKKCQDDKKVEIRMDLRIEL
ncbi:MAG: 2-amino-4-hydroxy-6-hydroxymethyldihydropteridine diphosphokinase [bacterium]